MQLKYSNAFVSAKITKDKENFIVVKTNEKTLYVTQNENFLRLWEDRGKGVVWKKFCQRHNAKMVKYDGYEIDDTEAEKRERILEAQKGRKKKYLPSIAERELVKLWERFIKGKGSYTHMMEAPNGIRFNIIEANKNGFVLVRIGDNLFFFDVEHRVYTKFNKAKDKKNKEVVWPDQKVA